MRRPRWGRMMAVSLLVVVFAAGIAAVIVLSSAPVGEGTLVVSAPTSTTVASGPTTTLGPPTIIDNRLFVVGDSVMQGAAPYLADEAADWSVVSDTRVGRFLDEGVRIVRRKRSQIGDVVVVGLGNNYGGDQVRFAAEVDEMLEALDGVDHIVWLTVAEFRDDRREVNSTLRAAARRDGRVLLVDWNSVWRRDATLTNSDRLHLSADGAQAMAALIADSLENLLRSTNKRPSPDARSPVLTERGSIPRNPTVTNQRTPRSTTTEVELSVPTTIPDDPAGPPATVPSTVPPLPPPTPAPPTSALLPDPSPPATDVPPTSAG